MEILGNKLRGDRRSKDLPRIPDSLESSGMLAATLGSDFFLATINSHLIKIPITRKQEREREREREKSRWNVLAMTRPKSRDIDAISARVDLDPLNRRSQEV